jgi:hypothetical protein
MPEIERYIAELNVDLEEIFEDYSDEKSFKRWLYDDFQSDLIKFREIEENCLELEETKSRLLDQINMLAS